jgi:hypothetical protein
VLNVDLLTVSIYVKSQKVYLTALPEGKKVITLYNILGKKILEEETNENATSISVKNLPKGSIYLVNLKTEKGSITKKIILQ